MTSFTSRLLSTCVIVEDTGRRSLKRVIGAVRDAGGTLTYVVSTGATTRRADEAKEHEVTKLEELLNRVPPLISDLLHCV